MATPFQLIFDVAAIDRASAVFARVGAAAESSAALHVRADATVMGSAERRAAALQVLGVRTLAQQEELDVLSVKSAERAAESRQSALASGVAKFALSSGIAAAAIAVFSSKMAGNFQQATNVLVTSAGESQGALETVRKGILDIASSTGTKWQTVTDGMYQIEKAGYRGSDALRILKASAQAAREEGASLAVVTAATTSVMASYHIGVGGAVGVTNEIKTAAGEAKTTMEMFAASLSAVLPIASVNKISFADIGGALASMTQHGTSAEQATQELSFTIRNLATPSLVAQKEMNQLGLDINDVSLKMGEADKIAGGRGFAGTLSYLSETVLRKMGPAGLVLMGTFKQSKSAAEDLHIMVQNMPPSVRKLADSFLQGNLDVSGFRLAFKGMPAEQSAMASQFITLYNRTTGFSDAIRKGGTAQVTYSDAMKKLTGGAAGLNTVLQLTGDSMAGTNERIARVSESAKNAGTDVSGWASTQGLFNVQIDRFKQSIAALSIDLGTKLLPSLTSSFGWLADKGLPALKDTFGFISRNSDTFGVFAAVIGTAVAGFMLLTGAIKAAAIAEAIFNAVTDANPIALTVIAIAALAAGLVYAYKHFHAFRTIVDTVAHALKTAAIVTAKFATEIPGFFVRMWHDVSGFVDRMWHDVSGFFDRMWHDVSGFAVRIYQDVTGWFSRMWADIVKIGDSIGKFFSEHWRLLLAIATAGVGLIYILVQDHWKAISGFFARMYNDVSGFVSRMWHDVAGFFGSMWKDVTGWVTRMWNDVTGYFTSKGQEVSNTATGIGTRVGDSFSRLWQIVTGFVSRMWHDVTGFFASMASDVWTLIEPFVARMIRGFVNIYDGVTGVAKDIWSQVTGFFKSMSTDIVGIFDSLVASIGRIWGMIKDIMAAPIRWVIENVYDAGIVPIFNRIGTILHEGGMHLDPLQFAEGGVVPGNHNRDTVPIYATPGEVVVPTSAVARAGGPDALMSALGFGGGGGAGGHYFLGGGVLHNIGSGIGHAAGAVGHAVGSAVSGIAGMVRGAMGSMVSPAVHEIESLADATLGGMGGMGNIMSRSVHEIGDSMINWVTGQDTKDTTAAASYGGQPGGAGGAAQWAPLVAQAAAMLGMPMSVVAGVLSLINSESGGNPNAINLTDSNAAAGHPSRGLMQTIPTTFEAYRNPALPDNIVDPLANIYAGMNYALHNYGVSMLTAGGRHGSGGGYVGYENGTSYVPHTGPAILHQGEAVLTARENASRGRSGPTVNLSGTFYSYDPHELANAQERKLRNALALEGLAL